MSKFCVYETVTNSIIAALESGSIPWLKPWKDGNNADPSMPYNATTGRAYNGVNVMLLWSRPYNSNGWLTYNQANQLDGNVKKGAECTCTPTEYEIFKKARAI